MRVGVQNLLYAMGGCQPLKCPPFSVGQEETNNQQSSLGETRPHMVNVNEAETTPNGSSGLKFVSIVIEKDA